MIDTTDFARRAEDEVRLSGAISPSTCQAWKDLPPEGQAALDRAMAFLGCQPGPRLESIPGGTRELDRVAAARLMLLKLGANRSDPTWSSEVLDRIVSAVMRTPGGSVRDLYLALNGVLGDYPCELSRELANLIKELVKKCFTKHRSSYESVDWKQIAQRISGNATKAQLYLALHAIPPQYVSPGLAESIVSGLESTPYHQEAANLLVA